MQLQPVILSGGSGTRLWPLSRSAYPKQFLTLADNESLIQATARRLADVAEFDVLPALFVCNEAHRFLVAEQLREVGLTPAGIILEPCGRNTAPALTLAALTASREGADPALVAMPADHVIRDPAAFRAAVRAGLVAVEDGAVVTFGIVPDRPETGFGYIRRGTARGADSFVLDAFVEKPDRDTAQAYVDSGDYYWNSGIFMMRASRWLALIDRYAPRIREFTSQALAAGGQDLDFYRVDPEAFAACPSDSIDYAVMEPLAADGGDMSVVVPLDAGWSDIGAFSSLWSAGDRDADGNVIRGDVFTLQSGNNLLHAEGRMLAAIGVQDLVVVETPDAVLVASKAHSQDVKRVVEHLKSSGRSEGDFHRKVHRPWGAFEGVDQGQRFQVKRLSVKPGAALSLQMHHHRAEHWIVVSGTARVTRGDEVFLLSENESTYIPIGVRHRLENPGTIPLEIIEVQSGGYLGEDDIVRFDDVYNRESEDS